MSHECPIQPCTTESIGDHKLMCKQHWALAPKKIRLRVTQAWNHGQGRGTLAYHVAKHAAIQSVTARLKARKPDNQSRESRLPQQSPLRE